MFRLLRFSSFQISPLISRGKEWKTKQHILSLPLTLPCLHAHPRREHTRGIQQKHQTEIEPLFQSELAVIFRKSDMLYVELQHHKVIPYLRFFAGLKPPACESLQSMWWRYCKLSTPMFWSKIWYSAHWPDSIKGGMWRGEGDADYPQKSASSFTRWFDTSIQQVKLWPGFLLYLV